MKSTLTILTFITFSVMAFAQSNTEELCEDIIQKTKDLEDPSDKSGVYMKTVAMYCVFNDLDIEKTMDELDKVCPEAAKIREEADFEIRVLESSPSEGNDESEQMFTKFMISSPTKEWTQKQTDKEIKRCGKTAEEGIDCRLFILMVGQHLNYDDFVKMEPQEKAQLARMIQDRFGRK